MKVLQINPVYAEGSTGNIARSLHDVCVKQGISCLSAHRYVKAGDKPFDDTIQISSLWDSRIHGAISRFTMFKGTGSFFKTLSFLKKVKRFSPDVIHLHNLHGSYINLPLLFRFIKNNNIPVIWTLHDCWAFTAGCSHFVIAGCEKWKTGCNNCPQKNRFAPESPDLTKLVWSAKKKWFTGVKDLTIVTPSLWLENLVKESFLKDYNVTTIYNGINHDIFKPTQGDFRRRYNLENKKIVLGVAFDWGYGKGFDVFIKLSQILGDEYKIVLVGTNPQIEKSLPSDIISVSRTKNPVELAEIYTCADVFVNPTREEVFGLVNIEALACATPVVTFDTGGSPECISELCGSVVKKDDIDTLKAEIERICSKNPYKKEDCIARAKLFDKDISSEQYINLYKLKG